MTKLDVQNSSPDQETPEVSTGASAVAPAALPLAAHGIGRRFGRHWALAHLDLEVETGECLLLAGHNGSGKTTFLRIVAGLDVPSAGQVRVFGHDPSTDSMAVRSRLSLVSHDSFLYERLTAEETVSLWQRLLGADDLAVGELLGRVGLADRERTLVRGFSAGMKKRLTLLRVLLEKPDLLLLDEPFAALDTEGQELIAEWVAELRSGGTTVIFASHNLERAVPIASRALLLEHGQVVWRGVPARLLQRTAAP